MSVSSGRRTSTNFVERYRGLTGRSERFHKFKRRAVSRVSEPNLVKGERREEKRGGREKRGIGF